jgi:DNA polymerase III subunit gamma/tau
MRRMSYVVLARKYRPRSFAQMVGQEHVVQALTNALTQGRMHHAYLFTGTRGIGKTTVSRILAKSLNCTGPDGTGGITAQPCGVCQACTEIDADRYLDYIEMDAASNGGKDEIKDLIERAAYKPGVGRFKVFMIDEAHQLSKDAFNALLKTLEEPPDYLKFVLATTDPDKVLPTVLSRCLQFNLRPMAPATVREHLAQVLQAEGVPFDDASLRLLGRAARGSMRDGLSLTDQAIAYGAGRLEEAGVRQMLGAVDRGQARAIVEALARRDGAALLAAVDGLRSLGLSASGTLEELARLAQQMAVEQAVPGALDAQDPDTEDARALAPLLAPEETQLLYSVVLHGRQELQLMSDEYGALTMVLLRVLAFPAQDPAAPARVALARTNTTAPTRTAALRAPSPPATSVQPGGAAASKVVARRTAAVDAPAVIAPATPAAPATSPPPVSHLDAPAAGGPWAQPNTSPGTAQAHRPDNRATKDAALASRAGPVDRSPVASPRAHEAEPPPWVIEPDDEGEPALPTSAGARDAAAAPAATTLVTAETSATAAADEAPVAATPELLALGDRWQLLVRRLADAGAVAALVRELAWQSGLEAVDDSAQPAVWRLRVERETLRNPALRDKLAALMQAELGQPVKLHLVPGVPVDSPARRDAAERAQRQAQAEAAIASDPLVIELLAQFQTARIVPGSIKPA